MNVLPLHEIPPVRKPKIPPTFSTQTPPSLNYAPRDGMKLFRKPTILEIVMVSCLLFIAAAIVLPRMVDRGDSTGRRPVDDLEALSGAISQFQIDTGRLPTTAEGLGALLSAPSGIANWHGPYIYHPPKDIWGHLYTYRILPSGKFEIRSAGPDGRPFTSDDIIGTS